MRTAKRTLRRALQFGFGFLACCTVMGQTTRSMEDGERAITIAVYVYLGLDVVRPVLASGNLQTQCIEAHAVVVTHGALETFAQDIAKVRADELDKCTGRFGCTHRELAVVSAPVALVEVTVGPSHVGDPC